jgi:DNA-binding MarR family transcriptional regulator
VEAGADTIMAAATAVRRGVIGLGRRLRQDQGSALTSAELSVLGHLHRRGPMSPGELAAADRVQPQSLTRTLASLEAATLLARRADLRDGRRSLLAITEAGQARLKTEMARRDAWLAAAMTADLTTTEIELLRLAGDLLERLAGSGAAAGSGSGSAARAAAAARAGARADEQPPPPQP